MNTLLIVVASCWFSFFPSQKTESSGLPTAITAMLNAKFPAAEKENFPGWRLAEVSQTERQWLSQNRINATHPAWVAGDFDGNGVTDYVVLIWYGTTTRSGERAVTPNSHLLAFLGQTTAYKMIELNAAGMYWPERINPKANGYRFVTLGKKGETRYDWDTGKRITYERDVLEAWVTTNGGAAYNDLIKASYGSVTIRRTP